MTTRDAVMAAFAETITAEELARYCASLRQARANAERVFRERFPEEWQAFSEHEAERGVKEGAVTGLAPHQK